MTLRRYSARLGRIDQDFLTPRLTGAATYDRISGYFTSSVLHLLQEPFSTVGRIRMVCNSDLNPADVAVAKVAEEQQRRRWHASKPEQHLMQAPPEMRERLRLLHAALVSGQVEIRVLPDKAFGFMHGKAGVITNGTKTAFMGSVNDTANAWSRNYELLWEDPTPDGVTWVQAEFDALWTHDLAVPLAQAVIDDLKRLAGRHELTLDEWRDLLNRDLAGGGHDLKEVTAPLIEAPLYTSETGLWPHQKAFVHQTVLAHSGPFRRARLLLADQVGLGKTLQLAVSAEIIALQGDEPVLIAVPKTLLGQWQAEMWDLLRVPSVRWDSGARAWVDERGLLTRGFRNCPRRIALVSSSWLSYLGEEAHEVFEQDYGLVILDEAHRARMTGTGKKRRPNNLYRAIRRLAGRSRSVLLATATPVQLELLEAHDLLQILAEGAPEVLGGPYSQWNMQVREGLELVVGRQTPPNSFMAIWPWYRSPVAQSRDAHGRLDPDLLDIRRSLGLRDGEYQAASQAYERLTGFELAQITGDFPRWVQEQNPYIRRIVMRTRQKLEEEGQLERIAVDLHGEKEAVPVSDEVARAYEIAEAVCDELGREGGLTGFARTALLRRISSSLEAGYISVSRMLRGESAVEVSEVEEDEEGAAAEPTSGMRAKLEELQWVLGRARTHDPKIRLAIELLDGAPAATRGQPDWRRDGCILFSQYLDTADAVARALSRHFPGIPVGLYTNEVQSGVYQDGVFQSCERQTLKEQVRDGALTLLVGTDAASEGLNLQRLSNLINIDLPWNPTRLEQRKGRIQRIGQKHATVRIYNMRYRGSIEDRVHQRLSERFGDITALFGLIPQVLEDHWVELAKANEQRVKVLLDYVGEAEKTTLLHPFERVNQQVPDLSHWDECTAVLKSAEAGAHLRQGWGTLGGQNRSES
ncbi:helicase-related protein [Deinococcus budaensis]|uniref:Superfamily II DNA or RNA helicase n=1 Tax=Deinococcus budaensis TaxID=1665626 RepID=A0A7W8GCG0_9DEIO|nr:helicase-related protein [Deinococcus budaensis]MBB5232977.1 superfamily II DNA or RNA helicase [Deinococcus budaensis]